MPVEGLLNFDYFEQRQWANGLLAVMARGTMLLGHWIEIIKHVSIYHNLRLQVEGAEALTSFVAGIGSASDVEVFAAANVEAILASQLKRCFYFHFN